MPNYCSVNILPELQRFCIYCEDNAGFVSVCLVFLEEYCLFCS
jgi:hypothetical protein